MSKKDKVKEQWLWIMEFIRNSGEFTELNDVLKKFKATFGVKSDKTFYQRLTELREQNLVAKIKRPYGTVLVLADADLKKALSEGPLISWQWLQAIQTNHDSIPLDQRGTALSSLLVSLFCDRANLSASKYSVDKTLAGFLSMVVGNYDDILKEAEEFVAQKCKGNQALLDSVTLGLAEISYSLTQYFKPYLLPVSPSVPPAALEPRQKIAKSKNPEN